MSRICAPRYCTAYSPAADADSDAETYPCQQSWFRRSYNPAHELEPGRDS